MHWHLDIANLIGTSSVIHDVFVRLCCWYEASKSFGLGYSALGKHIRPTRDIIHLPFSVLSCIMVRAFLQACGIDFIHLDHPR